MDDKEYEGNLLSLLENAEVFIKNNSRKSWGVSEMQRDEHEDYPHSSVREALINAIIHRDYQIIGSEIHIDMYPDRVEITSPGGMPDGSKIQALDVSTIPSMRRNMIISDVFGRLRIMERRGSGLSRIIDGYNDFEVKPAFYSESSYFRVTLPNKNYSVQGTAVSSFVQPRVMLSPSEEKVLELIAVNPAITGERIAENLDVSLRHAKRLLEELKEKGAIQRIGSAKSGHWEIIINMPGQKHQYMSR